MFVRLFLLLHQQVGYRDAVAHQDGRVVSIWLLRLLNLGTGFALNLIKF
jgi:hypothetical protein